MRKQGWAVAALLVVLAFGAGPAGARIPEPDHLFYGQVTSYGTPVATATVTVVLGAASTPIASFALSPSDGGAYVLRVPMDSVDPQDPGTARGGEEARIYVNGLLSGRSVVGTRGEATRVDLDPAFDDLFSVQDVSVTEGNTGTVDAVFTITLSDASPVSVSVNVATSVSGATATPTVDFTPLASSTLTFAPGELSKTVTVTVKGDVLNEADETYFVDLANPSGAGLGRARAFGIIVNDDATPVLTVGAPSTAEGNPGGAPTSLVYPATLDAPSGQAVSVAYATTGGTATPGADYAATSGVLSFPQGVTSLQIAVPVVADYLSERDETVSLALSAATNVVLATPGVDGTIVNDDARGSDFDGDGRSDLLLQGGDGRLGIWLMGAAGAVVVDQPSPSLAPAGLVVVATPDLNADGRSDILFAQDAGSLTAWLMDGLVRTAELPLAPSSAAAEWSVRASADMNGDDKDDILWQNAAGDVLVWTMDGLTRVGEVQISGMADPVDPAWRLVAAEDVNGDGSADLVWQNIEGDLAVSFMNGTDAIGAGPLTPDTTGGAGRIVAAGDFNADHEVDFVFQEPGSPRVLLWEMSGTTRTASVPIRGPRHRAGQVVGPR